MDNISHSVVSLVAGELLHRSLPTEETPDKQNLRQKLLLFTACAAGNFPDLDLVLYSQLRKPLGYLLHHRGHSHTFLYEIPQALLLFALTWVAWAGARHLLKTSLRTRLGYVAASAIGFSLHIAMDFLNSYGVHPFHPFNSNWFYGDLVFIVEPLFWIAFGLPVAFLTRRVWLRYPFLLLIVGVPLWGTFRGFVPPVAALVLTVVGGALTFLQYREFEKGRTALVGAFAIAFAFIITQAVSSHVARLEMTAAISKAAPKATILDVALTAYPSNPICWSYVSIEESQAAGTYRLRSGLLSLAPAWMPPAKCPFIFGAVTSPTELSAHVVQLSSVAEKIQTIVELNASNCHLNAWLRFARMPYVTADEASDLRFSRENRPNFTTFKFKDFEDESCARYTPPWTPPREDLLSDP